MMSKQNTEMDPGAMEVTASLIVFTHLPALSWTLAQAYARDEGFLRPGPHFRGQYSPGCSEKCSRAVSINPVSVRSSIPQLVLLCLVSKPLPAPILNQSAQWHRTIMTTVLGRFPASDCLYFLNQGCSEIFLAKASSRGTTWSPWPAKGEPLPSYDSPSHRRRAWEAFRGRAFYRMRSIRVRRWTGNFLTHTP